MIPSKRIDDASTRFDQVPRIDFLGLSCVLFICLAPAEGGIFGAEGLERYLWFVADAATIIVFLTRREQLLSCLTEGWPLLAWPALAVASAAWSLTPGISLYHGLQLLMTVLGGFALCATVGLPAVLRLVFWGLLLAAVLSVGAVYSMPRTALGTGNEWLGIYPHKNVLGSMMAMLMLCAACLFLAGWHRALTSGAFMAGLAILYLSRSASALCAATIGLAPLLAVVASQRSRDFGGVLLGLSVLASAIVCTVLVDRGGEVMTGLLSDLGKDGTLTGRTILWQFGMDQFSREPWLGLGYKAYWESTLTTAAYLNFTIKQKLWFFHNNFLDIAVAFGVVGLGVFAFGLMIYGRRVLAAVLHAPNYVTAWPVCFGCYTLVLACFENVLFQNHSLHQFLLAAAMPIAARATAASSSRRFDFVESCPSAGW